MRLRERALLEVRLLVEQHHQHERPEEPIHGAREYADAETERNEAGILWMAAVTKVASGMELCSARIDTREDESGSGELELDVRQLSAEHYEVTLEWVALGGMAPRHTDGHASGRREGNS